MIRWVSLAAVYLFFCQSLQAQGEVATSYVNQGVESALQSDYLQAAKYYAQAREYYLQHNDIHSYVECEFLVLDCLLRISNFNECASRLHRLQKYIQDREHVFRPTFLDTAGTSLALFEIEFLSRTGNVAESIDALNSLQQAIADRNATQPSAYHDQRLIQISLKLANAYAQQGDCENAGTHCTKSLSAMEAYRSIYVRDGLILQPYLLLARCYADAGDIERTKSTYLKTLNLLSEIGSKKSQRAFEVYLAIFDYYLKAQNPDSAEIYLRRMQTLDSIRQHKAEILRLSGDYYLTIGNAIQAEQSYQQAIAMIVRQQGERNEAIALCRLALGKLYLSQKKPDISLQYFQLGLYGMADAPGAPRNSFANPPLSSLYLQRSVLEILNGKAAALDALSARHRDPVYQEAAWQTIRLATRFTDALRTGYIAESDKSLLIEHTYPVFEDALDLAYRFNLASGDPRWIDSAFVLMEESKALNLRDAVLHGHARKFAGIPDSLLQLENALRLEIGGMEQLIRAYRASAQYQETTEVAYLNELASKKEQYRALISRYERDHPKYYALKHKPTAIGLQAIRSTLGKEQTVLEYFVGDEAIYLLSVNDAEQRFSRLAKDFNLEEWVGLYRKALQDFAVDKGMEALKAYARVAHDLYVKLMPTDFALDTALLIIPDGVLGYLSFSSLLRDYPADVSNIRRYDYLLWHHDISYSYSANLYLELQGTQTVATKEVLICAPQFSGLAGIPSLRFSQEEARSIQKITSGQLLSGTRCTLPAFYATLNKKPFSILHLATHGSANDKAGDASYLVFSGEQVDNALLHARDLYTLDMPFDMVYLSACETGTGELRRGEGMISLARAFFYSGVRSLVTTLWRVEDSRSAHLAEVFYRYLQGGARKDKAMSQAQRAYLTSLAPDEKLYAHPVYWSALIPVGNMQAVEIAQPSSLPAWIIGVLVVLGAFLLMLLVQRLRRR